jgi:hypothetical protein
MVGVYDCDPPLFESCQMLGASCWVSGVGCQVPGVHAPRDTEICVWHSAGYMVQGSSFKVQGVHSERREMWGSDNHARRNRSAARCRVLLPGEYTMFDMRGLRAFKPKNTSKKLNRQIVLRRMRSSVLKDRKTKSAISKNSDRQKLGTHIAIPPVLIHLCMNLRHTHRNTKTHKSAMNHFYVKARRRRSVLFTMCTTVVFAIFCRPIPSQYSMFLQLAPYNCRDLW